MYEYVHLYIFHFFHNLQVNLSQIRIEILVFFYCSSCLQIIISIDVEELKHESEIDAEVFF